MLRLGSPHSRPRADPDTTHPNRTRPLLQRGFLRARGDWRSEAQPGAGGRTGGPCCLVPWVRHRLPPAVVRRVPGLKALPSASPRDQRPQQGRPRPVSCVWWATEHAQRSLPPPARPMTSLSLLPLTACEANKHDQCNKHNECTAATQDMWAGWEEGSQAGCLGDRKLFDSPWKR